MGRSVNSNVTTMAYIFTNFMSETQAIIQCESKNPPRGYLTFFHKWMKICNPFFTHLLYDPIYARLQIFIQLSPTLTNLCHIKRFTQYAQNVHHRPKRMRSDVCVSH